MFGKGRKRYTLIIMSHAGPSGLGSEPKSICGKDWKLPSLDWGDRDLSVAISQIQKRSCLLYTSPSPRDP